MPSVLAIHKIILMQCHRPLVRFKMKRTKRYDILVELRRLIMQYGPDIAPIEIMAYLEKIGILKMEGVGCLEFLVEEMK